MSKHPTSKRASAPGRRPRSTDPAGRERLLDVAIGLFAERGIANTTVAQIAASAQVTSAMVYYWFETREKLLDAVADERVIPVIQQFWAAADPEHEGAIELVQGLLGRLFDVTEKLPWLPSLWLREIIQGGGLLRERVLSQIPRERTVALRSNLLQAQGRGEINPRIKPELLMISMLGLVMLPLASFPDFQRVHLDLAVDNEQFKQHVTALLMHGVAGAVPERGSHSNRSNQ